MDLLELKVFREVDLDESPLVVLGCGHFFTAETLDGMMQMDEVYLQDAQGKYCEIIDDNGALAKAVPKCPDCKRPVQQYVTKRYNRVVNRAVIDETSKRFLVSGKEEINSFNLRIQEYELDLEKSRVNILDQIENVDQNPRNRLRILETLQERESRSVKLLTGLSKFTKRVSDENQPARRFQDATINAIRSGRSLEESIDRLSIKKDRLATSRDKSVQLGGRLAHVNALFIVFADKVQIIQKLVREEEDSIITIPGEGLFNASRSVFRSCEGLIADCSDAEQPKLGV